MRRTALTLLIPGLAFAVACQAPESDPERDDNGTADDEIVACDPATFTVRCNQNNKLITCEEGNQVTRKCDDGTVCNAVAVSCGYCGDGTRDPGEQCDDANTNDLDDCHNNCTLPTPACDPTTFLARCDGNTLVQCDDGIEKPTLCGDERVCNPLAESCGYCGDGVRDPGEACDPPGATCSDDCAQQLCNADAECDDDDLCTADACADHQCEHTAYQGCCHVDADCPSTTCYIASCQVDHNVCASEPDFAACPELCTDSGGKLCNGSCGSVFDPSTGCAEASCDPCEPPITSDGYAFCHPATGLCAQGCPAGQKACNDICFEMLFAPSFGCDSPDCDPCPGPTDPSSGEAACGGPFSAHPGACDIQCYQDYLPCGDGDCCQCSGDGICDPGEDSFGCPSDCPCGDGFCDIGSGEEFSNCPADCTCGNGVCERALGEQGVDYFEDGFCQEDCYCGNGVCEPFDGEDGLYCPEDCDDCPEGTKPCGGLNGQICVFITDPHWGCGDSSCAPCPDPIGGTAACAVDYDGPVVEHVCGSICGAGTELCDGACVYPTPENGCGSGTCAQCPKPPNVDSMYCAASACTFAPYQCKPGWEDLDGDKANGCETPTPTRTGMKAWWRSDRSVSVYSDGVVARLPDQSGNGQDLTPEIGGSAGVTTVSPTLMSDFNGTGLPCVRFMPNAFPATKALVRKFTDTNFNLNHSSYTIFAQVGRTQPTADTFFLGIGRAPLTGSWCGGTDAGEFWGDAGTCPLTRLTLGYPQASQLSLEHFTMSVPIGVSTPALSLQPERVVATFEVASGYTELRVNDTLATGTMQSLVQTLYKDIALGAPQPVDSLGGGQYEGNHARFNGWVCEVMIYDRILAPIERELVSLYLQRKWMP